MSALEEDGILPTLLKRREDACRRLYMHAATALTLTVTRKDFGAALRINILNSLMLLRWALMGSIFERR